METPKNFSGLMHYFLSAELYKVTKELQKSGARLAARSRKIILERKATICPHPVPYIWGLFRSVIAVSKTTAAYAAVIFII